MVGGARRVGVVPNALDFSSDADRLAQGRAREFRDLREIGLVPEELDLRAYLGAPAQLEDAIARLDALWVVGGNAFVLRRAMSQSGLDRVLVRGAHRPGFVYAAYSAGSCVVGSSLRGIDLVDDPSVVPAGYAQEPLWDGLGLAPFAIAPHYRSPHPESGLMEDVIGIFINNGIRLIALRDGEVYISRLE